MKSVFWAVCVLSAVVAAPQCLADEHGNVSDRELARIQAFVDVLVDPPVRGEHGMFLREATQYAQDWALAAVVEVWDQPAESEEHQRSFRYIAFAPMHAGSLPELRAMALDPANPPEMRKFAAFKVLNSIRAVYRPDKYLSPDYKDFPGLTQKERDALMQRDFPTKEHDVEIRRLAYEEQWWYCRAGGMVLGEIGAPNEWEALRFRPPGERAVSDVVYPLIDFYGGIDAGLSLEVLYSVWRRANTHEDAGADRQRALELLLYERLNPIAFEDDRARKRGEERAFLAEDLEDLPAALRAAYGAMGTRHDPPITWQESLLAELMSGDPDRAESAANAIAILFGNARAAGLISALTEYPAFQNAVFDLEILKLEVEAVLGLN